MNYMKIVLVNKNNPEVIYKSNVIKIELTNNSYKIYYTASSYNTYDTDIYDIMITGLA